jgi:hypothetical protein
MTNLILQLLTTAVLLVAPSGGSVFGPSQIEYQGHVYLTYREGTCVGHNCPGDIVIQRDGVEVYHSSTSSAAYRLRWWYMDQPFAAEGWGIIAFAHESYWQSIQTSPGRWEVLYRAQIWILRSENGLGWTKTKGYQYGMYTQAAGTPFVHDGRLLIPAYAGDQWGHRWATILYLTKEGKWGIHAEHKPPTGIWYTEGPIERIGNVWVKAQRANVKNVPWPEWIEVWESCDFGRTWRYLSRLHDNTNYPTLFWDGIALTLCYRGDGGASCVQSADGGRTWGPHTLVVPSASGLRWAWIGGKIVGICHLETGAELLGLQTP